jgi:branched-chain amino acid transport system ATP-binding protein
MSGPHEAQGPILTVQNVYKHFGGVYAVAGASFDVQPGTVTALIGPNGAGKTTLFNIITGFLRPDQGSISYAGHSVARKAPYIVARRGLVRTFQLPRALTTMPVIDNMMLAAPSQPGEHLITLFTRPLAAFRREKQVRARALELLETFDLAAKAQEYAGTLSGGQQKLLELARALMVEPSMVLLDEPMAGINPTLGRRLLEHMQALRREQGLTFLFVEHDMDVVMNQADRVIVMAQGRVIADGTPETIRRNQQVIDAYLGDVPVESVS